jgi:hypothetical protein
VDKKRKFEHEKINEKPNDLIRTKVTALAKIRHGEYSPHFRWI